MRVVVIRTGGIGDVVSTLPVLQSLSRAVLPENLCVIGNAETLSLAEDYICSIHSIDRAEWAPFFVENGRLPSVRVDEFMETDLVLSYLPDRVGHFAENLRRAGVHRVVFHNPHPPRDGTVHIVDHLSKPLFDLGIEVTSHAPLISVRESERDDARRLLEAKPCFVIHPGSGGVHKCWPAERFAKVADRISREFGHRIILLSGPADGDRAEQVANDMRTDPVRLHYPPLRLLAAVLHEAVAYLGNDSGPSHVAAAVGARAVVLFGATDPRIWAPRGKSVKIVEGERNLDMEDRLESISGDRAVEAVVQVLESMTGS